VLIDSVIYTERNEDLDGLYEYLPARESAVNPKE